MIPLNKDPSYSKEKEKKIFKRTRDSSKSGEPIILQTNIPSHSEERMLPPVQEKQLQQH